MFVNAGSSKRLALLNSNKLVGYSDILFLIPSKFPTKIAEYHFFFGIPIRLSVSSVLWILQIHHIKQGWQSLPPPWHWSLHLCTWARDGGENWMVSKNVYQSQVFTCLMHLKQGSKKGMFMHILTSFWEWSDWKLHVYYKLNHFISLTWLFCVSVKPTVFCHNTWKDRWIGLTRKTCGFCRKLMIDQFVKYEICQFHGSKNLGTGS